MGAGRAPGCCSRLCVGAACTQGVCPTRKCQRCVCGGPGSGIWLQWAGRFTLVFWKIPANSPDGGLLIRKNEREETSTQKWKTEQQNLT